MGRMKYINEEYAEKLLGKRFPLGLKRVTKLLDQFLNNLVENGDSLPMDLLFHNISKNRNRSLSEFAKVDADMVIQFDNQNNRLNIDLRDYRIHSEFARDVDEQRVVLHLICKNFQTTWVVHLPLQSMMVGFEDPMDGYHCYSHGISFLDNKGNPLDDDVFYCGITKRGWLTRMNEHFREIRGDKGKIFHKQWREYQGDSNVLLNSELVALNHSFEAAMDWEEWIVKKYMDQNKSLNMIPGGFAGLKSFSRITNSFALKNLKSYARGERSFLYVANQSRRGIANPMIQKLWRDDRYYTKVIGNRDSTFSIDDVIKIRKLAIEGQNLHYIGQQMNIKDLRRIKNILDRKTYRRM